ncbi:DNA polymerase/3'-5' exonuclease PolX [Solirubrobacter sp. CPCC 204708]|uniref:DNA-directed DNA polymerase n=1 Tax=Solirubrobacter deserti TaxID=2282478 RepID=A0ABT4RBQ4_9ACTN|nr:DNA polymerase/3'-5' exonuclease PolX [Solirubrobacter deserti]MBE2317148.1 DNA polymerase/3'-5' exonuclease PolX [Solirubrobacter deserti]MDA0135959.1 DNA polymerase/3'-5' exonuclease PolX [Solirubrobacter deserti]
MKTNAEIAAALDELGDLYELDGAVSYRVIAYRTAAKAVRDSSVSIMGLTREGKVTSVPGIGKTLEEKLRALDETGDIPSAVKLRAKFPAGLVEMTKLPGFGAKRARQLHDALGVDTLEGLRALAEQGEVRKVKGFGPKGEENLLKALAAHEERGGEPEPRVVLSRALPIALEIAEALRAHPASDQVEVAGSARRWGDSVKDIDIIATASDAKALVDTLAGLEIVESVSQSGEAGARAVTHSGMKVDLKVVAPDQFGNVLQHFTGSKAHNVQLREAMVRRGLHISEYGVLDDETGETTRCATEEEVYERLGLPWIPPELREGRGELDAALKGELPQLITLDDMRGDLHCHTTLSDGRNTLEEMVAAAQARGYEYLAITDHSASHGFGNHVTPEQLEARIDEIAALNERLDGFRVLAGTESNILPDGTLDYPDELLERLDWVIGSIHTSFGMDESAMTERMLTAINHPWLDAIGHPTGRKIETRPPYSIDMARVIEAAAANGTMIEINSAPDRRDMNDVYARAAAAAGVTILIDSDAHGAETLANLRYGVATARRAWLTAAQVANTRPLDEFLQLRKRGRSSSATT